MTKYILKKFSTRDPSQYKDAGIILCMRPANERRRYNVSRFISIGIHIIKMRRSSGCFIFLQCRRIIEFDEK